MEKVLSVAEALYPGYSFFFMFDNTTSYLVYTEDALCVVKINKKPEEKQIIFAITDLQIKTNIFKFN